MTWQVGLYVAAVLIPLAAFTIELLLGRLLGRLNAVVATGAIGLSFLLSLAGFIAYSGYQIARATTGILSDRIVISDADLERVVMSVAGVLGCHNIRTRGAADHVFLDLHVWLPPDLRLTEAHDLSHVVKDRLMARYPQIADAVIHIEPPPADRRIDRDPPSSTSFRPRAS